jgi:hypothetical protein
MIEPEAEAAAQGINVRGHNGKDLLYEPVSLFE